MVFDLLWLDGHDLMNLPLTERKDLLRSLIQGSDTLRYSESYEDGHALYDDMVNKGLEGIVAKKKDSPYLQDDRGSSWLKIPTRIRQEFVIGAYAESENGRAFKSLLFGAYNVAGALEWIGRSGGGFKHSEMPGILKQLKKLETVKNPFANKILDTKGAVIHYLKPQLVANFEFAAWTESGRIRKPATFLGFRQDKDPKDVLREMPKETQAVAAKKRAGDITPVINDLIKKNAKKYLNADSGWIAVDKEQQGAEWHEFKMKHCTVPVHNINRELWKGIPKGKLLICYNAISSLILPHLHDRPQSLNLKVTVLKNGMIDLHSTTFLKDMEHRQLDCAQVYTAVREEKKPGKRDMVDYLVINNTETLVYAIDLGCVDLNPWSSRIASPREPDYLWLDLDPTIPKGLKGDALKSAEDEGFSKAIETAIAAKEVLKKHKLASFIKTSGKTGLHIYLPCAGFKNDVVTDIAYKLAHEINALAPDITTLARTIAHRGTNVYIDPEQNYYTKTLAAPYSVRPYHEPLVSTPLDWREIKASLDRYAFNIDTIQARIQKKGDLFRGVDDRKIAAQNSKILQKLLKDMI